METLSPKLERELRFLYDVYKRGSQGLLYYPQSKDDTPPKRAFIRVKRLAQKGMVYQSGITTGHPVYSITPYGIDYLAHNNSSLI